MSVLSRRAVVGLLAALVAVVCRGALASGASALTQVNCTGVNAVTYSPPLTNTLQSTTKTVSATFANCVSLTNPNIHAATTPTFSYTAPSSCESLLGTVSGSATLVWNTGQTSTFTYNAVTTMVSGEVISVITGSITAGLFDGATAEEQTTLISDVTACTTGIAADSGPAVLSIIGL